MKRITFSAILDYHQSKKRINIKINHHFLVFHRVLFEASGIKLGTFFNKYKINFSLFSFPKKIQNFFFCIKKGKGKQIKISVLTEIL